MLVSLNALENASLFFFPGRFSVSVWLNSPLNLWVTVIFLVETFSITDSVFLIDKRSFRFSMSSYISFIKLQFSRYLSISSNFFTLLAQIMCCSSYPYITISARSVVMCPLLSLLCDFSPFFFKLSLTRWSSILLVPSKN